MAKERTRRRQPQPARPAVEWIAGALSCALVVALIAFLFYRAVSEDAPTPDLSVTIEGIEQAAGGTIVRIAVANSGDAAASAVTVHAARRDAPEGDAGRQIEFDYVAGHAVRRGAFVFPDAAIAPGDLEVEIGGFVEP